MRKIKKFIELLIIITVIFSINVNAAISVADGSTFITKAELVTDLSSISNRLSQMENAVDNKIDSLVSTYLNKNGIWNGDKQNLNSSFVYSSTIKGYRTDFPKILRTINNRTGSAQGLSSLMSSNILHTVKIFEKATKTGLVFLDMQLRRVDGGNDIRNNIYWGVLSNLSVTGVSAVNGKAMQIPTTKSCFYGFDLADDSGFTNILDSFSKSDTLTASNSTDYLITYYGFALTVARDIRCFFIEKDKPLYMRERFNYNLNGAGQAWLQFSVNINNPNSNASTVSSLFYYIYSCNIY